MKRNDVGIMTCYAGSLAYGTNLPSSDVDIRGLFCAPQEFIRTPFFNVKEQVMEDQEDGKLYEVSNFMKLFSEMNPNIIELMFVDKQDVITDTPAYQYLRNVAPSLLTSKVAFSFSGYAMSQLKRIKGHDKWINNPQPEAAPTQKEFFRLVHHWMEESVIRHQDFQDVLTRMNCITALMPLGNDMYQVIPRYEGAGMFNADGSIRKLPYSTFTEEDKARPPLMIVKYLAEDHKRAREKHRNYWQWKENRNAARHELEIAFGYDTKHAMHLVRLMRMAEEILSTGQVHVRRPDAQELLSIRAGAWSLDELLEWAEYKDAQIQGPLYKTTSLPRSPDYGLFAKTLMTVQDMCWSGQ